MMDRINKWRNGLAVLAAIVMSAACMPQANATVQITLTNGNSSVTVQDGGLNDSCLIANCVTYNGALGNYLISVSTGLAQNGLNPFLVLNSINLTLTSGAGLLTIATSSDGYTAAAPQFNFSVNGNSGLGGPVSFSAFGGNSNTLFDTSNQIGSTLAFGGGSFSGLIVGGGNTLSTYSLTLLAKIGGVSSGVAGFDAELSAIPEPATMTLLGVVLLFTGNTMRRKFRRSA